MRSCEFYKAGAEGNITYSIPKPEDSILIAIVKYLESSAFDYKKKDSEYV